MWNHRIIDLYLRKTDYGHCIYVQKHYAMKTYNFERIRNTLSDVTIAIDDTKQIINANKFLLAAVSPYFENVFSSATETDSIELTIPYSYLLLALIDAVYTGDLEASLRSISDAQVLFDLLKLCSFLQIDVSYINLLEMVTVINETFTEYVSTLHQTGSLKDGIERLLLKKIDQETDLSPLPGAMRMKLSRLVGLRIMACDNNSSNTCEISGWKNTQMHEISGDLILPYSEGTRIFELREHAIYVTDVSSDDSTSLDCPSIYQIKASHDQTKIYSMSFDRLYIWDADSLLLLKSLVSKHVFYSWSLDVSSLDWNRRKIAYLFVDDIIHVLDLSSNETLTITVKNTNALHLTADGERLLRLYTNEKTMGIDVYSANNSMIMRISICDTATLDSCMMVSRDGKRAVVQISSDSYVTLDIESLSVGSILMAPISDIKKMALSPSGDLIAMANNKEIAIVDYEEGKQWFKFSISMSNIVDLCFV